MYTAQWGLDRCQAAPLASARGWSIESVPPNATSRCRTGQSWLLDIERLPEVKRLGRTGFFPPEVFEDVRRIGRFLVPRGRTIADGGAARRGLVWLWLLLLLYPFTDYLFTALQQEGVPELIAAFAFVLLDAGIIVTVLLSSGDPAGARFFGGLVLVLDVVYAATGLLRE